MPEEEKLKSSRKNERGSGKPILVLALLVFVVGAAYFIATRNSSVQNAFSSLKESTQDAATTSRVRTALLLSKHVSPFDIKAGPDGNLWFAENTANNIGKIVP